MTATPRLFRDASESKAAQANAVLCSMEDESIYGKVNAKKDRLNVDNKGGLK